MTQERRAAVLGKPVAHSLSPVIHNAGYAAAGLSGWSYLARECAESELADLVAGLGPEWRGLSLTMPLKEVALEVADEVDPAAAAIGAANTFVRRPDGRWRAVNTDAPGIVDILAAIGMSTVEHVALLGAGGTARAALAAVADMAAAGGSGADVTVYARRPAAIDELRGVADVLGVRLTGAPWAGAAARAGEAELVISTVPKGVADPIATSIGWRPGGVLLDALYDPWPTPLAAAAADGGCQVVSGLDLLLAQAVRQFEWYTGAEAPVGAMRSALLAAVAARN